MYYYFLNWEFLGEVKRRLKTREVITFTKPDVKVQFRYTNYPCNWDGSGSYYREQAALEKMVWRTGEEPRYTNWY